MLRDLLTGKVCYTLQQTKMADQLASHLQHTNLDDLEAIFQTAVAFDDWPNNKMKHILNIIQHLTLC
jgi:hypothetical protein